MAMKISDTEMRQAMEHQRTRYMVTIVLCVAISAVLGVAYAVV